MFCNVARLWIKTSFFYIDESVLRFKFHYVVTIIIIVWINSVFLFHTLARAHRPHLSITWSAFPDFEVATSQGWFIQRLLLSTHFLHVLEKDFYRNPQKVTKQGRNCTAMLLWIAIPRTFSQLLTHHRMTEIATVFIKKGAKQDIMA